MICDNNYHILAISDCIDGNHNDGFELIENIEILTETLKKWILTYKTRTSTQMQGSILRLSLKTLKINTK